MPSNHSDADRKWRAGRWISRRASLLGCLPAVCLATATLLGGPAPSPPARIYAADPGANSIVVIDPVGNSVLTTIPLPASPGIPTAALAGHRLLAPVPSLNRIVVIDTATNAAVDTITHASLSQPVAVVTSPNQAEAWVVNRTGGPGGNGSVTVINLSTLAVSRSITSPSFSAPEHVAFTPNATSAYVVNTGNGTVTQVVAPTYTVNVTLPVGATPRFAVGGPGNRFIYLSDETASNLAILDTVTRAVTSVALPGNPRNMTLAPALFQLFVALQNNRVAVFDLQTQTLRSVVFPNGAFVSHAVTLQAGTRFAYVSDRNGGAVAAFDTRTLTPVGGAGNPVTGLSAPQALVSTGTVEVANLSVTLSDAPDPAMGGVPVTYTAQVSNAGPSSATGTVLRLDISAPFELLSATSGQGSCRLDMDTVVCDLGTLELDASVPITVQVRILVAGSVTATARTESEESDPNLSDNTATATTSVTPAADLAITILDQPDPVPAGGLLTYLVDIVNRGPTTADAVRFLDPLPQGVLLDSIDAGLGNCVAGNTSILCNLESIRAGDSRRIVINVVPTAPGNLVNGVDVRSTVADPDPSNNAAVAVTTVRVGQADLALAKNPSSPLVNPGSNLLFQLVASNLGPDQAAGVQISDPLPAGVEFVSVVEADADCQVSEGVLSCRISRLAPFQSRAATARVRVTAGIGETVSNSASVSFVGTDPNPANNQASASVQVVARGDLNGDGVLDAADVQSLVLEINDGDGESVADAAGGSHPGNSTMDLNGDRLINQADLAALVELIFGV